MKRLHGFGARPAGRHAALLAAIPLLARADYSASFATIAASGRQPLSIHGYFMVVITVLFVAVFGIMVYTMIQHRRDVCDQPEGCSGPTGTVQWLWAMVPFAILLFVDYVLFSIHFGS